MLSYAPAHDACPLVPLDPSARSTTSAALTYLHGSDERQRAIAEALSNLTAAELRRRGTGTYRVRKRRRVS